MEVIEGEGEQFVRESLNRIMSLEAKKIRQKNFNYNTSKIFFNQELLWLIYEYNMFKKIVMRREDMKRIIEEIKSHGTSAMLRGKPVICNDNNRDILCRKFNKVKKGSIVILEILSADIVFDILTELYLIDPWMRLKDVVKKCTNCLILPIVTRAFWKACGKQARKKNDEFSTVVEMEVIPMPVPDRQFTHILIYVERHTNFLLLRPLMCNSPDEITYELLNIFCDYGPPSYVNYCTTLNKQSIWNTLESLNLPFDLPTIIATTQTQKIMYVQETVSRMIVDWMTESSSKNWGIALHLIQWIFNTSPIFDVYIRSNLVPGLISSPYHALFGKVPNKNVTRINTNRGDLNMNPEKDKAKILIDCSQCKQPIYKVYTCYFCQANCHFYCCQRIVKPGVISYIINKCKSCPDMGSCFNESILS